MAAHRPLPADSELVQAVAVLARAHQDAVWDKTQMVNRLRSHLREYYPAALQAFHGASTLGLDSSHARAVLAAAPTPAAAARLTRSQLCALLNRAGRLRRGIDTEVERLREIFRRDCLHQLRPATGVAASLVGSVPEPRGCFGTASRSRPTLLM